MSCHVHTATLACPELFCDAFHVLSFSWARTTHVDEGKRSFVERP